MQRIDLGRMAGMFAEAAGDRVRYSALSKATLVELSHVLEDIISEHSLPGVVLTGFQTTRNWRAEVDRYERLASPNERVVAIFAGGDIGDTGGVIGFRLVEGHPLTQEWFIIARTSEFSVALFGEDNPTDPAPAHEMDRLFEATWTFDASLVAEFCDLLVETSGAIDPVRSAEISAALAQFPARRAAASFEQEFHHRVFVAMEAGRRRWREALLRNEEIRDRLHESTSELVRLERLAAVGRTAASLAHELNNPLATISMTAELLLDDARAGRHDPDSVLRWAGLITEMASRGGRMTHDILDLVRGHQAVVAPLELGPWLRQLAEELGLAHHRRVVLGGVGATYVLADPDRLRHILTNLVVNGLQASKPHTPVELHVDLTSTHAAIRVVDHGSGIPDEIRSELFVPFRSTRTELGGTGLGLALALRFAEDQHCALELTTTGPEGTTFTLSMPIADPRGLPPAPETPAAAFGPEGTRHVLVLDDDPDVRALIAHLLRLMEWEVRAVADIDAAVEAARVCDFDAAVIDYRLGHGITGLDALERLEAARPGIFDRSIVISGSLSSELPMDRLPPVLTKPFSRLELEAALLQRSTQHGPVD